MYLMSQWVKWVASLDWVMGQSMLTDGQMDVGRQDAVRVAVRSAKSYKLIG